MEVTTTNKEKLSSFAQCFLLASVEKFNSIADLGLAPPQVPRAEHPTPAQLQPECLITSFLYGLLQQMLPHKSFKFRTTVNKSVITEGNLPYFTLQLILLK